MKYETDLHFDFNNTMTLMINDIEDNSTVLEFGPASGRLTKFLKEEKKCKVYIVEIDAEAGAIAAQYAERSYIGDIEKYVWTKEFAGVKFDYILFADVLEHLYSPKNVLEKCYEFLKENGKIIFSVPNIAHNSIIIDLLKNKFDYQETGLLDNTHIRFWTTDIIENMLKQVKLNVVKKGATYTQVGLNEFKNSYEDLKLNEISPYDLKTRYGGEVYQYYYVVTKSDVDKVEDFTTYYSDYYYLQYYVNDKVTKHIYKDGKRDNVLKIKLDEDVDKVRVDFLNAKCTIRIDAIENESGEELKIDSTNAYFILDNIYFYKDADGQMFIFANGAKEISIKYRFLEIEGCKDVEFSLGKAKEYFDISLQKEDYINELRENIAGLNKEIEGLNSDKDKMNEEINLLKGFANSKIAKTLFKSYLKRHNIDYNL